ncbi:MAG: sensor histidine kinase YesM [Flavobacteriaceae bacterium]
MGTHQKKQQLPSWRMIQVIILLCCVSAVSTICLHWSGTPLNQAWREGILSIASSLPFILTISVIQRYNHSNEVFGLPTISTTVLFTFFSLLIFQSLAPSMVDYSIEYTRYLRSSLLPRAAINLLFFLLITALFWIDKEHAQVERLKRFAIDKERESNQLQLNSIQQKFKPHFLFNSLNSISALSITNPEESRKMIVLLSDFMRKAVKEDQNELISIQEEIEHIQRYTEIEKIRFGDRLTINYNIDVTANNALVPALILQPVIENAIKYGLYGQLDEVTITIKILVIENALHITVENPFDDESQRSSIGTGYGLRSIEQKLLLIYKRGNLLTTADNDGIYSTHLIIPQYEKSTNH